MAEHRQEEYANALGTLTINDVEKEGLLLYKYIRGSHAYGLNVPESDMDTGGVYLAPIDKVLGLGYDYQEQVASERNDDVFYEFKKFMNLLMKSNPTALESLFIDDEFVIYEHPIITELKKHRHEFITKECFNAFGGYAISQIRKARGLKKKIVNPIKERLCALDFAYTFYKQGSSKISNFLEYRHLEQNFCGLVNVPNMLDIMGVYYDWANFFKYRNITKEFLTEIYKRIGNDEIDTIYTVKEIKAQRALPDNERDEEYLAKLEKDLDTQQYVNMMKFIFELYKLNSILDFYNWYDSQKPQNYTGIVHPDGSSNELRAKGSNAYDPNVDEVMLCSVAKDEKPICHIAFNKNGYQQHCREYKEYKEWEANRNQVRFELNRDKEFDRKNLCHSFRLLNMAIECAKYGEFNVNRRNIDRDFLLSIRTGESTYDELISKLDVLYKEFEDACAKSKLPDTVDVKKINQLLVDFRKRQFAGEFN